MYIYRVYPAMSKTPQERNCAKRAETSVVLNIFNGIFSDVGTYTVTVSYCLNMNQVPEQNISWLYNKIYPVNAI